MSPDVEPFDEVEICRTPETEALGYAGARGTCYGFTTPSATGVKVIGDIRNDRALNVHFDDARTKDAWFSTDLVELVSHGEGTVVTIGDKTLSRNPDGSWASE